MIEPTVESEALRQAAELILQDEGLTADLEDPEATALLHWALAAARQVVSERLQRGQPVDRAAIAEAIHPVRRLTRTINDLVAHHNEMDRLDLLNRLLALLDAACQFASGTATQGSGSISMPPVPPS